MIRNLADGYLNAVSGSADERPPAFRCETLQAPHMPPQLPPGRGAVYVFALAEHYTLGDVEPRRVLKVGKAGTRSNARFQYQHYSPGSAGSTLAASILNLPELWPFLGIGRLDEANVKPWILTNCDRHHIYMRADNYEDHASQLERYIRGITGPVFEG